jgi:hypothetical protein
MAETVPRATYDIDASYMAECGRLVHQGVNNEYFEPDGSNSFRNSAAFVVSSSVIDVIADPDIVKSYPHIKTRVGPKMCMKDFAVAVNPVNGELEGVGSGGLSGDWNVNVQDHESWKVMRYSLDGPFGTMRLNTPAVLYDENGNLVTGKRYGTASTLSIHRKSPHGDKVYRVLRGQTECFGTGAKVVEYISEDPDGEVYQFNQDLILPVAELLINESLTPPGFTNHLGAYDWHDSFATVKNSNGQEEKIEIGIYTGFNVVGQEGSTCLSVKEGEKWISKGTIITEADALEIHNQRTDPDNEWIFIEGCHMLTLASDNLDPLIYYRNNHTPLHIVQAVGFKKPRDIYGNIRPNGTRQQTLFFGTDNIFKGPYVLISALHPYSTNEESGHGCLLELPAGFTFKQPDNTVAELNKSMWLSFEQFRYFNQALPFGHQKGPWKPRVHVLDKEHLYTGAARVIKNRKTSKSIYDRIPEEVNPSIYLG